MMMMTFSDDVAVVCVCVCVFMPIFGKSSESVQCAITGPCLRMRHRPSA